MNRKMTRVLGLAVCLLLPAARGMSQEGSLINPGPMELQRQLLQNVLDGDPRNAKFRKEKNGKPARSAPAGGLRPASAATSLSYKPNAGVSARVRQRYLASLAQTNPASASGMRAFLQKNDPIALWERSPGTEGLRKNDVGDVYAAYWILNWKVANGDFHSTRAQNLAVRRQLAPTLAGNPIFKKLTNAQRQEMAEMLILDYVAQQVAYGTAMQSGDADRLRSEQEAAATRFKNEMRIDLRALALTDQGFRKKAS